MRLKIVLFTLVSALTVCSLSAGHGKHEKLKIEVIEHGYSFKAPYKLQMRSLVDGSKKSITVNAISGPTIIFYATPTDNAMAFRAQLSVDLKGKDTVVMTARNTAGRITSNQMNFEPSSPWYLGLQKLLNKIVVKFDSSPLAQRGYGDEALPIEKGTEGIGIKALSGTALDSQYYLFISSALPRKFPYVNRTHMHVHVTSEKIKKHKDRVVTAEVRAPITHVPMKKNKETVIKFAVTKDGLKTISRKNIKPSCPWSKSFRKMAKKSVKKYVELDAKHHDLSKHAKN